MLKTIPIKLVLLNFLIPLNLFLFGSLSASALNDSTRAVLQKGDNIFIPNYGQWPDEVLYMTRNGGMDVWLTKTGAVFDMYKKTLSFNEELSIQKILNNKRDAYNIVGHVFRLNHINQSKTINAVPEDVSETYVNFFKGKQEAGWHTNIPVSGAVLIENLYNNIDQRWYYDNSGLRYDYIVKPFANYSDISFRFEGTNGYYLRGNDLIVETNAGEVMHTRLFVYQMIDNIVTPVISSWQMTDGNLGFNIGTYDKQYPLIIDPLIYSTFIGNFILSGDPRDIVIDASGNSYITGYCKTTNYPVSIGAYTTTSSYEEDVFVSKVNPNGTALIFSSYFGGSSRDYANAIGIDAQNNIYLGGCTFSTNFPVTSNAFDTVFSSSVLYTDAFVLKLNNTGNTLVYSTYLGGKFEDEVKDLVVDSAGYAYLTGYTMSYHFPVTPGSYDVTYPHDTISLPGLEVFVTKMNLTGSGFIYSSFVGGDINSNEMAHAITIDGDGNAYVCGQVISSGTYTFPVTTGAYITSSTSPYGDGFAFKLNNTGTDIIFSSFLGETVGGEAYAIAIDDSLNTYIAGKTYSDDFPTTVNAYDSTYNGSNDIYFVKLNPAGSDALISTFIGGSDQEYCVDIAVDKSQKPYIMGYTRSNDYPYTTGAYDTLFQYNYDSFLTILKADGTDISYSTFLTPGNCTVAGMAIDASNNIYFTGTGNSNYTTTAGTICESIYAGYYTAFITKFNICSSFPTILATASPDSICEGGSSSLVASGATVFEWSHGLGNTATVTASPLVNTTYTVTGLDGNGCAGTVNVAVVVNPIPVVTATANPDSICEGETVNLTANGADNYVWSHGLGTAAVVTATPQISTQYSVTGTDDSGCSATSDVSVFVSPLPIVTATALPDTVCPGDISQLTAAGANQYEWSHGLGAAAVVTATPFITTAYTVTGTDNVGCSNIASVIVDVSDVTVTASTIPDTICKGDTAYLTAQGAQSYVWSHGLGNASSVMAFPLQTTTYTVTGFDDYGCSDTDTVVVNVSMPVVTAIANPDTICAGNHTVLTASGAATYTWSDNLGSSTSVIVFPAASVTYTVVGYNILNCSDTAEVSVVVLPTPLPVITATALPDSICSGDTTILTANGGTSYLWSDNLGATGSVNAAPLANTTYTVTATANNGCYNTASVSVFVNPLPQAQANNTGPYCEGDTVYFQAQGGASYLWSGPLGFNSNNANAHILNSTIAMSGLYVVTVTSDVGCEDTAQTHLSVNALPLAVANASNTQICLGDMDTLTATGGSQYLWSTNQNTAQIIVSPSASQSYTVTVNNGYCSDTASLYITVNPLPNANAGNDTTVNSGTPFNLSGNGGISYQWFPDTYLSSITAQNPVCVPSQSIQYVLTVYNAFGCTNTDTVNITVIDADCGEVFVPNAFSPNNDGINDEFIIHGNCIESVKVLIYNQWGTKVFEGINSSVLWNGYFEEQAAPAGVYSYYIVYVTNTNLTKTIKGNIILMN